MFDSRMGRNFDRTVLSTTRDMKNSPRRRGGKRLVKTVLGGEIVREVLACWGKVQRRR
jgi:hypothetical protein